METTSALLFDANLDGQPDLLFAGNNQQFSDVGGIYLNNFGFIGSSITLPALSQGSYAVGDIDNDGDLDIVAVGDGIDGIQMYENVVSTYGNTFRPKQIYPLTLTTGASIALADIDGDGRLDIAVSGLDNQGNPRLIILHQEVDGSFTNVGPSPRA